MRAGLAGRAGRHGAIVFPVIQRRLFIASLIGGGFTGDISSYCAIQPDDFFVVIEERFYPGVSRQHADHMRHSRR